MRELREQLQRDGRRPRHRFDGKVSCERPLTPASLHAYHRVLRAFYRYRVSQDYFPDRGVAVYHPPRVGTGYARLHRGRDRSYAALASSSDRLILELLVGTGLRVYNCMILRPDVGSA